MAVITQLPDIITECHAIQSFLEITMSDNPDEAVERGNQLSAHIARSGKLLADAKHHYNSALKSEIIETLRDTAKGTVYTAKAINALVDSAARNEAYAVDWCDRINRTATHQLDWCRTVISKAKTEMMAMRQIG